MKIPLVIIFIVIAGLLSIFVIMKKKYGWTKMIYLLIPVLLVVGYVATRITNLRLVVQDPF